MCQGGRSVVVSDVDVHAGMTEQGPDDALLSVVCRDHERRLSVAVALCVEAFHLGSGFMSFSAVSNTRGRLLWPELCSLWVVLGKYNASNLIKSQDITIPPCALMSTSGRPR